MPMNYYYGFDYTWYLLVLPAFLLALWAQLRVKTTYAKYSRIRSVRGRTAAEVASELLGRYSGEFVQIEAVQGRLTDHFNPATKTVGLSTAVYGESSVAALAVAAHEIGHVLQHQEGYLPIRLRNAVLPAANIGSNLAPWIVIAGVIFGSFNLAMVGVVLFGAVLLFQLVTLPAELNASSRALRMLEEGGYVGYEQTGDARKVLRAAAMTYVLATIAALISFLRLFMIAASSRRRD